MKRDLCAFVTCRVNAAGEWAAIASRCMAFRSLASGSRLTDIEHESVVTNCRGGADGHLSGAVTGQFGAANSRLAHHTSDIPPAMPHQGGIFVTRLATTPTSGLRRLQRRPYRYALALVLTLASLVALILLYIDQSVSVKDKATQIGTGLASAIIFAVIYTILANREFAELIRAEISDQLTGHRNDVLHQIQQLNLVFLPTDQYPATKEFDARFNRDLNHDLTRSTFYFFRGTSAKYIPARLQVCDHHLDSVQVILLDPRDDATIEARAKDRRKRPECAGMTLATIKSEVRAEILLGFVALFDCRDQCDIEIGVTVGTSPVRIEVFDDAIYTSMYRSPESERNTHPETARFSKDSQTYQIFRDECRRQMQLAMPQQRFTSHDSDHELSIFLETLGFDNVGNAELDEQRAKYREFIAPFSPAFTKMEAQR